MLFPKLKPGERIIVEYSCVADSEGRLALMADVIERMPQRLKPVSQRRRKPLQPSRIPLQ